MKNGQCLPMTTAEDVSKCVKNKSQCFPRTINKLHLVYSHRSNFSRQILKIANKRKRRTGKLNFLLRKQTPTSNERVYENKQAVIKGGVCNSTLSILQTTPDLSVETNIVLDSRQPIKDLSCLEQDSLTD